MCQGGEQHILCRRVPTLSCPSSNPAYRPEGSTRGWIGWHFKGSGSGRAREGPGLEVGTRRRTGRASWRRAPSRWGLEDIEVLRCSFRERLPLPPPPSWPSKSPHLSRKVPWPRPTRDPVPPAPSLSPWEPLSTPNANPGMLTAPQLGPLSP